MNQLKKTHTQNSTNKQTIQKQKPQSMVSLGKLSLNKYTVINISRSIKWFIRQSLLKKAA